MRLITPSSQSAVSSKWKKASGLLGRLKDPSASKLSEDRGLSVLDAVHVSSQFLTILWQVYISH